MRRSAVLVVIDNAESLLTATGAWLDPAWEQLLGALTARRGLGRVVFTTRRLPKPLPADLVVEAVHALTRDEAVLLARQLPHLARLLDTQPAATRDATGNRQLARTILEATGGHPKLLELADAHIADPDTLAAMLTHAGQVWGDTGIDRAAFLTDPDPDPGPGDPVAGYVALLEAWTTQAIGQLDPSTILLSQILCRCPPADRTNQVIDGNWADIWRPLGLADPPPPHQRLIDQLAAGALIETHRQTDDIDSYDIHPVIAATIATGTPDGVHFATLIAAMGGDGDQLLDTVLTQARNLTPEQIYAEHLATWETTLALLLAATAGNPRARTHLDHDLDQRAQQRDWAQLSQRLAATRDGQRDPATLTAGLDPIDTAIVTRALNACNGTVDLDPTPSWMQPLTAAIRDHDPEADEAINAGIDQLAALDGWAALATQLRRIAAGNTDIDWDDLDRTDTAILATILTQLDQAK